MRVKLTLAYDGTGYRGWAPSAGQKTIHSTLTQAVFTATHRRVEIIGASRTDSGAHALGQVCHFDTDLPIEPEKWPRVLNKVLPPEIAVLKGEAVSEEFHSRFCAEDRWYRYRIQIGHPNPLEGRFAYSYWQELDLSQMRFAALLLEGRHDFRAFTEELGPNVENTFRTLRRVEVREEGNELHIDVVGTAFLRGMMRRIAGGLLEVGRHRRTLEQFGALLTPVSYQLQWPVVLPARGLCLMEVRYGDPPRDCRTRPGAGS